MLEEMKALTREKDICVLATIIGSRPYCSLMAYVTNKACTEIYMVTNRQTQKYKNIVANPEVSLMIDSRETSPRSAARALTIEGVFKKINDREKKKKIRRKLLSAHPHLDAFMDHPETEVLRVKVRSFLLLNGLNQASFKRVPNNESCEDGQVSKD